MTEQRWYYLVGSERVGPMTQTEIKALIRTGRIAVDTLLCREGMDDNQPAEQIVELWQPEPSGFVPADRAEPKYSGAALVCLLFSLLAIVAIPTVLFSILSAMIAFILGILGLRWISAEPSLFKGRGMIYIGIAFSLIASLASVVYLTLEVMTRIKTQGG